MASITVRIDDETRDALDEMARLEGVSLSDFVRGLLREAVVPVIDDEAGRQGDGSENTPDSLSTQERQTLSLLHRILARVLPEDSNDVDGDPAYQLERAKVLEAGYVNEYGTEFAGIQEELSRRDCARVMDILDMFRIVEYSVSELATAEEPLDPSVISRLQFRGFDHNDSLEGKMADYVEFLIDSGRWTEREEFVKGPRHGNSHMQVLSVYLRMLTEYRRIGERRRKTSRTEYLLSASELSQIAESSIHPSRRLD